MSILNLRNDKNIGKYENIAEWSWLLAKKVQVNTSLTLHEYIVERGDL